MDLVLTPKNAKQRRSNAIGMLSCLYLPQVHGETASRLELVPTPEISGNIRKLAQLGRTERWQGRIEQWARMVEQSSNDRDRRWAFLQGMIYATHAL